MRLEYAEKIVNQMQNMGVEAELDAEYSGRGMFGKATAGIVTEAQNAPLIGFALAVAIADSEGEEALLDFNHRELPMKSDSLGLSMIFY